MIVLDTFLTTTAKYIHLTYMNDDKIIKHLCSQIKYTYDIFR